MKNLDQAIIVIRETSEDLRTQGDNSTSAHGQRMLRRADALDEVLEFLAEFAVTAQAREAAELLGRASGVGGGHFADGFGDRSDERGTE